MNIRAKYTCVTAALIAAVVGSITFNVVRLQRRILEGESAERLNALMEGVTRIAQEAVGNKDELMLLSYIMFLQKEHPEMATASVGWKGHTARIGKERPDLRVLARSVSGHNLPVTYTVTVPPGPSGAAPADLQVTPQGVSLDVSGPAAVRVDRPQASDAIVIRIGFITRLLKAEVDRALLPLLRDTVAIAGLFMGLGMLAAVWVGRLLTGPLTTLASAAVAVGRGDFEVSVPEGRADEVGILSERFNRMTESLRGFIRFREDILHTLTHELNTPLSGLKGYLELWQEGKVTETARTESVQTMMAAVLRMEQSLTNALQLFRAEHGAATAGTPRLVWVDESFRQVLRLFEPVALSKRISVQGLGPETIGYVFADEELVKQVATNLVSNALKYTPDGGWVRLGLNNTPEALTFWVADTGPGIHAKDLPRVFEKFERVAEPGRRIPGTGLGLHIARRAVEAMGGRIWVESEVGKGSTFFVSLPKAEGTFAVPQRPQREGV